MDIVAVSLIDIIFFLSARLLYVLYVSHEFISSWEVPAFL